MAAGFRSFLSSFYCSSWCMRGSRARPLSFITRSLGWLRVVDLGALQLTAVVEVDGLPFRVEVQRRRSRLAVAVARLLGASEGQVGFGADRGGVYVKDARLHVAHSPKSVVHVLGINR